MIESCTLRITADIWGKSYWTYAGEALTGDYHCVQWSELPSDYYEKRSMV